MRLEAEVNSASRENNPALRSNTAGDHVKRASSPEQKSADANRAVVRYRTELIVSSGQQGILLL
jgi:hypothetical protein